MSVRAALGASRWRVIRQLLIEAVLLALLGGILGTGLAVAGVRAFALAVAAVDKPYWIKFTMDYTVLGYVAGISLATGIIFGLFPALHASKIDVNERLKEGTRGSGRGRRSRFLSAALVVTELALAVILLAGAGLMIRSFLKLYEIQAGVNAHNLLTMQINLAEAKYPTPETRQQLYDRLLAGLSSVPGVESVALASHAPISGSLEWKFQLDGQAPAAKDKEPGVGGLMVSPGYFRTTGIQLLRGRAFDEADGTPGRSFAIVNQRFALKYWPGQDPIGKRIRLIRDSADSWVSVIGVSADVRQNDPMRPEVDPVVYLPYRLSPVSWAAILTRTHANPSGVIADLRRQVQQADEELPVYRVQTMGEYFDQQRWAWRVFGSLFAIFAVLALALSAIGIYGVMAYSVAQRSQEIGVRMALGASAGNILKLVFSSGIAQIAVGLAIGLAGAFGVTRAIRAVLIQTSPTDPLTFGVVAFLLASAAILACWFPARRALKLDPLAVLRYE
jgi:predicted permease